MTEATQKTIAVVAVVAAVAAIAALTVGIIAFNKIGILTTDDQPVTLGGGSLHLSPTTGWARFTEDTTTHTATAVHIRSADYTSVDWACNTDDTTTITTSPLNIGNVVTLVYGNGNNQHTLTFTRSARNELTLAVTGNMNGVPMLRHLMGLGVHGKKNWRFESITSNTGTVSCTQPGNNTEFFLQFK